MYTQPSLAHLHMHLLWQYDDHTEQRRATHYFFKNEEGLYCKGAAYTYTAGYNDPDRAFAFEPTDDMYTALQRLEHMVDIINRLEGKGSKVWPMNEA